MAKIGSYRIRWANVSYGNGRRFTRQRMCLAERRNWLCWWPVIDGDWHFDEGEAFRDIEHDQALRSPLPSAKVVAPAEET